MTSASAPSANPSAEQKDDLEMSEDSVMKRLLSMEESPSDLVKKLKDHAKELRKERNKCRKDLRNAVRRNKRLRDKAKNLCDNDLVDVLRMRATKKSEKEQTIPDGESDPQAGSASCSGARTPSPSRNSSASSVLSMETPPNSSRV